jgi:hypothetical protein
MLSSLVLVPEEPSVVYPVLLRRHIIRRVLLSVSIRFVYLPTFPVGDLLTSFQKGSILALPETLNTEDAGISYIVEGIGYDFIPDVLSRVDGDIDEWLKTSDEESFAAARMLMRMEGLLCGGSSGAALSGALHWLETAESGKKIAQTPGANVVCTSLRTWLYFL